MKSFDEKWEEIHSSNAWGKYPTENVIKFIARNYYQHENRKDIRILDYGCGAGAHTWYLCKENFSVWAFDGSKSAVEKTINKLKEFYIKNTNVQIDIMDGADLSYEDSFFDCVIDSGTICANTLENIYKMYSEIYRVLKSKGKLLSTSFSINTTGYNLGEQIESNTFKNISKGPFAGGWTHHFYTKGELEKILKEVGYENIIIETMTLEDGDNFSEMFIVKAEKL
ncbi:class I SAM-dependent methyltransferase [Metasolibacillus meyeri]|uniref:class I SAM-dependent methyltransferase n=1 Tax=Metasolibacillus meyeri TaxID=1071052 RepID=UPI000D2FB811|nr:class I SAM-dependent methyltransferase [Metasolibacillus meyeri]